MFSDHSEIKLEINNRTRKSSNWKLNNTFLKTAWVKNLVSKEIKIYTFEWKLEDNISNSYLSFFIHLGNKRLPSCARHSRQSPGDIEMNKV